MGFINSLFNNIIQNFDYVRNDFTGFNLDINFIFNFILNLIVTLIIFNFTYLFGKKIFSLFNKNIEDKSYSYLISIGLGYIISSLGIAILGFFHLLYPQLILIYILFIIFISLFPFNNIKKSLLELFIYVKNEINYFKQFRAIFIIVSLFIFLGFINLINPEYREDQYHVDLPRQYLRFNTNMIPPKEQLHVSAAPQTAESYYLIGIFLLSKEAARFLHFYFYLLTILTLINYSKINPKYKFAIYTPLLLVSSPVIIKETSSMYTDFQWLFCLLISALILIDQYKNKFVTYSLSGLFFGGIVASKLWTIIFYPVFSLFLILKNKFKRTTIKYLLIFIFFSLLVYGLWLIRSYILTGNPLYPAFINHLNLDGTREKLSLFQYIGVNYGLLNPKYFINVFSPLFFIGMLFFILNIKKLYNKIRVLQINQIIIITSAIYLLVQYIFGRYMIGLYIFLIFVASLAISELIKKNKLLNVFLIFISILVFIYYFINSILILPYSLGFSDKNNYLTRILIRDNSSYFDFDKQFNKHIKNHDAVGLYNFHGYYYADFNFIDINFVIENRGESIKTFKKRGIKYLILRGSNLKSFCKKYSLKDCDTHKPELISEYNFYPYIYFYSLKNL